MAPNPAGDSSAARPAVPSPSWQRALGAWLAANRVYPFLARQRGLEGTVTLRFSVRRSGVVTQVAVIASSGHGELDAAARDMLNGATVPPFPAEMPQENVNITVQVRYQLTR